MQLLQTTSQKCVFLSALSAVESTIMQISTLVGAYKHVTRSTANLATIQHKLVN
jgi:hypothetical protein